MGRRQLPAVVAVLLVVAGLWYLLPHPGSQPPPGQAPVSSWADPALDASPPTTTSAPPSSSEATAPEPTRAAAPARISAPPTMTSRSPASCRGGEPKRLRIPALGVDAPFERVGLDRAGRRDANGSLPLGTPTDRTHAGWYAAGPRPGSGTGTVLVDGHTYRDGSAIFQEDFAGRIATGQLIQLRQDNGSVCSYRVTRVWREISSAQAYPRLIASQHLYDFNGPERLLLATCGGTWNPSIGNYDDINVVLALPVTAP